jgi:hypothetical protein
MGEAGNDCPEWHLLASVCMRVYAYKYLHVRLKMHALVCILHVYCVCLCTYAYAYIHVHACMLVRSFVLMYGSMQACMHAFYTCVVYVMVRCVCMCVWMVIFFPLQPTRIKQRSFPLDDRKHGNTHARAAGFAGAFAAGAGGVLEATTAPALGFAGVLVAAGLEEALGLEVVAGVG